MGGYEYHIAGTDIGTFLGDNDSADALSANIKLMVRIAWGAGESSFKSLTPTPHTHTGEIFGSLCRLNKGGSLLSCRLYSIIITKYYNNITIYSI